MKNTSSVFLFILFISIASIAQAENGYKLWLRYVKIDNKELLSQYRQQLTSYQILGNSSTTLVIQKELELAFNGMLDSQLENSLDLKASSILIGTANNLGDIVRNFKKDELNALGFEGYIIKTIANAGKSQIIITANNEAGLLYGTFHFLRLLQQHRAIDNLNIIEIPENKIRVLNHWDNMDRTSERGYAGFSIWDWHRLPDYLDQRYVDYARTNASIGINGTVLTSVNANAIILKPHYLEKVKALADLFRPYGIKVYLTARFSAPIEIGGLETADPLDPDVIKWWNNKVKEIYTYVPDFGGLLVKANSEGQPGPQNYGRSHAEGANLLANALKPFGGVVMWRAFVYSNEEPVDRAKQAYNEFKPLDGTFLPNVLVQVKNGPIDFQPREPFHPLFGAMPKTPLMMEFQITQEYLGQATQLVYLGPLFKECLESDTYSNGKGSSVANVVNGTIHNYSNTGIAGVANIGTDINWTGHPIAQSNWYAFGRLAWNSTFTAEDIAEEWISMTFSNDTQVINPLKNIMMDSREAAVNYMTPLGLHHQMGPGHHYGPGPWVSNMSRADWTSVYYHKADKQGIGFDRSATGSNAIEQYFPEVANRFGSVSSCPEELLLWFHHVSWDRKMKSGRILWDELAYQYQEGVNTVREMKTLWSSLEGKIDQERFESVKMLLTIQEKEAVWWKDACLLYFQTFSNLPFPEFIEKPEKTLEYYQSLQFPFSPGIRPRW